MKRQHKHTADRRPGDCENNKRLPDEKFQDEVSEMIREIISKDGTFVAIKGERETLKSLNTDVSQAVRELTKEETTSKITVVEREKTDAPITANNKKRGRRAAQTTKQQPKSDADKIEDIKTKTNVAEDNTPLAFLYPLLEKRYERSSSESIVSVLKQSVLRVDNNPRRKGEVSQDKAEWMRVCKHSGFKNDVYEMDWEIIKRRYRGSILACIGSLACATAVTLAQAEKDREKNNSAQHPDVQRVQASAVLKPTRMNKLEEKVFKALLARDENCGIANTEDRVSVFVMTMACTYAKLYFDISSIVVTPSVLDKEQFLDKSGNITQRDVPPDNKKKKKLLKNSKH